MPVLVDVMAVVIAVAEEGDGPSRMGDGRVKEEDL